MRKSAFRRRRTAHRLGQVEAYLTVREVLSKASTAADDVLSREPSGFYRCRYATLELIIMSRPGATPSSDSP